MGVNDMALALKEAVEKKIEAASKAMEKVIEVIVKMMLKLGAKAENSVAGGRRLRNRRAAEVCEGFVESLDDVPSDCKVVGVEAKITFEGLTQEELSNEIPASNETSVNDTQSEAASIFDFLSGEAYSDS